MPDDKDPREPTKPPIKRRGGKKPRRAQEGAGEDRTDAPPGLASVTQLFGEDAERAARSGGVEIPPSGTKGKDRDPRKRVEVASVTMGKRWSEIFTAVENGDYTWEEFCASLTPAELARGQLMDKDGFFRGRPPKMVPRAFLNACTKELMTRGAVLYKENYVESIKAMTEIAGDPRHKAADRIKAAQFVIERLEGKVPQVVQVTVEQPWEVALSGMVAEASEDAAISRAHDYTQRQSALSDMGQPDGTE